jgi:hypothetical protein
MCITHFSQHAGSERLPQTSRALLFAGLAQTFPWWFFASGKAPANDILRTFFAVVGDARTRRATFRGEAVRRDVRQTAVDMHGLMEAKSTKFFKEKSFIRRYREAEWNHERIPDDDVPIYSRLGALRLGNMKHVVDPDTQKRALETLPWSLGHDQRADEELDHLVSLLE